MRLRSFVDRLLGHGFLRRSNGLSVALVLLACACSKATPAERSTSFTDVTSAETTIETEGLRIEITGHVRYVNRSVSSTTGGSSSETTLNGHPFGVRDGVFFIGPMEYGPAPAKAVVKVDDTGVSVNEEFRGKLPPALEGSEPGR